MTLEFAIRDDDTNYFTDPNELRGAYSDLPSDISISLGVVPFHGCTRTFAIPEEKWNDSDEEYPIAENDELVNYLRKKISDGRYSIMLHGYNHVKVDGNPEFVAGDNLYDKLVHGKKYLEDTFSTTITTFVPPNNSFSREGLQAVKQAGLKTLYYPTPFARPISLQTLQMTCSDLWFKYCNRSNGPISFLRDSFRFWVLKQREIFMPVNPIVYSAQGEEEFTCVSMNRNDPTHPIKRQINVAGEKDGKFCLAIHYPAFRYEGFRERFMELLKFARNNFETEFVTVDELFS